MGSKQVNKRAAEALALQAFDDLRAAQRKAILAATDDDAPALRVGTRSNIRRALERAEIVKPGSRSFTPWGLFMLRAAQARKREAGQRRKVVRAWSRAA